MASYIKLKKNEPKLNQPVRTEIANPMKSGKQRNRENKLQNSAGHSIDNKPIGRTRIKGLPLCANRKLYNAE